MGKMNLMQLPDEWKNQDNEVDVVLPLHLSSTSSCFSIASWWSNLLIHETLDHQEVTPMKTKNSFSSQESWNHQLFSMGSKIEKLSVEDFQTSEDLFSFLSMGSSLDKFFYERSVHFLFLVL